MIVELGLKALHEPGVIRGRRQLRKHGIAWIMGGVKGGINYGKTDELGFEAVENRVHLHDLHATILHIMGLDHELLTYFHQGRNESLTDVHGRVIGDILA